MYVRTESQEDMKTNMIVTHYLSSSTHDVWFTLSGKINMFFQTLIWKTGRCSMSNINCMSVHEWSAAERVERHNTFLYEWKIRRCSISTHKSTYFFRRQDLFSYTHTYVWLSLIDTSFTYQVLLCTT